MEEGVIVAVATSFGGWDIDAVVAIVVWSRADIPSMLAVVGPVGFSLLFLFIDNDLGS